MVSIPHSTGRVGAGPDPKHNYNNNPTVRIPEEKADLGGLPAVPSAQVPSTAPTLSPFGPSFPVANETHLTRVTVRWRLAVLNLRGHGRGLPLR